jgi:predicted DNA-binding protein
MITSFDEILEQTLKDASLSKAYELREKIDAQITKIKHERLARRCMLICKYAKTYHASLSCYQQSLKIAQEMKQETTSGARYLKTGQPRKLALREIIELSDGNAIGDRQLRKILPKKVKIGSPAPLRVPKTCD